jgi:hypothetical protein
MGTNLHIDKIDSDERIELAYFVNWLIDHYPDKIHDMERKLCNCFHNIPRRYTRQMYPACVSSQLLNTNGDQDELYWDTVNKNLRKEYPELAMEYYMLGED